MKCIFCRAPTRSRESQVCQVCYGNLSPERRALLAENETKRRVNSGTNFSEFLSGLKRRPSLFVALIVLCFFLFNRSHLFSRAAPKVVIDSNNEDSDPCYHKKRCLIVYVAPWCGACQADAPFLGEVQTFVQQHTNIGFKVYVGQDQVGNLRQFASTIKAPTFVDDDNSVGKGLGVHSFPSYFWLDEKGKIIDYPRRSYYLLPDKTQVESYFLGVLAQDKAIIFGAS